MWYFNWKNWNIVSFSSKAYNKLSQCGPVTFLDPLNFIWCSNIGESSKYLLFCAPQKNECCYVMWFQNDTWVTNFIFWKTKSRGPKVSIVLGNVTNTNITANKIWHTKICGQGTRLLQKPEKMRAPKETSHWRYLWLLYSKSSRAL